MYRVGKKLVTLQKFLLKPMYTSAEAAKVLDFWVFYTTWMHLLFWDKKNLYIYIYTFKLHSINYLHGGQLLMSATVYIYITILQ